MSLLTFRATLQISQCPQREHLVPLQRATRPLKEVTQAGGEPCPKTSRRRREYWRRWARGGNGSHTWLTSSRSRHSSSFWGTHRDWTQSWSLETSLRSPPIAPGQPDGVLLLTPVTHLFSREHSSQRGSCIWGFHLKPYKLSSPTDASLWLYSAHWAIHISFQRILSYALTLQNLLVENVSLRVETISRAD